MPFLKVTKTKAYFKRYQTQFRRRREGRTDYQARRAMVTQAKNKYQAPRYRLVVRFTTRFVICQIVSSTIEGDHVLAAAYSSELPRYGLKVGLKNYAAAYCTGLLVARRVLKKLNMDEMYTGVEEVTGEVETTEGDKRTHFLGELSDERRPFRCVLDVGLTPTTRGHRLFGALKGASDGGLDIPHSERRFPGYDAAAKSYDAGVHRERIMGAHVANYMRELQESDDAAYRKVFSKYVENNVAADGLEEMLAEVHKAIRANPTPRGKQTKTPNKAFRHPAKRSLAQFKDRVRQKLENRARKLAAAAAAEAGEEEA